MATVTIQSSPEDCVGMTIDNPTGGVSTGELVQKGSIWVIAVTKSPNDDDTMVGTTAVNRMTDDNTYTGVYRAPDVLVTKDASTAIDQGNPAYFDSGDGKFYKTTGTGRFLLGFYKDSYLAADTSALIDFDGKLPLLV